MTMRMAFVVGLILLFILAPIYLIPHVFRTDSSHQLVSTAARDIVAGIPELHGVKSIMVAPLEQDYRKLLQFSLVHELRRSGKFKVIEGEISSKKRGSLWISWLED